MAETVCKVIEPTFVCEVCQSREPWRRGVCFQEGVDVKAWLCFGCYVAGMVWVARQAHIDKTPVDSPDGYAAGLEARGGSFVPGVPGVRSPCSGCGKHEGRNVQVGSGMASWLCRDCEEKEERKRYGHFCGPRKKIQDAFKRVTDSPA